MLQIQDIKFLTFDDILFTSSSIVSYSVDLQLGETRLKHFVVVHVLVILLGRPVEFAHWDLAGVHDVQQLHRDGAVASLFHLSAAMGGEGKRGGEMETGKAVSGKLRHVRSYGE
jgi:hypothetical protein